jgi:hypothetical protein
VTTTTSQLPPDETLLLYAAALVVMSQMAEEDAAQMAYSDLLEEVEKLPPDDGDRLGRIRHEAIVEEWKQRKGGR